MFKPAVHTSALPEHRSSLYPEPFRSRMGDRVKRRLGDAFGLTQFGVNLVRLAPGGQSALRHFHSHEEELAATEALASLEASDPSDSGNSTTRIPLWDHPEERP